MQNTEKTLGAWNGSPFGTSPWRLLDEMFGTPPRRSGAFAPAVDVSETAEEYLVTAELPGTKPEDVTVELNDGILTVRGEKRLVRDEQKEHARYAERVFGSFVRSFSLPPNANGEKVQADFKDGLLSLRVRKRDAAKPRTIAIQSH
jgi:HSP20 family protein